MTTMTLKTRSSHFAEYLQTAMVTALIAGVVGFLAAAWSPAPAPEIRAEQPAAASRTV
jgi:hypothetical protein